MGEEINFELLHAQLEAIHQAGLQAHLEQDAAFFVQDIAEDYLSVSRGNVQQPSKTAVRAQFERYLSGITFAQYEDVQPPQIGFSADGSLAWLIAQVQAVGQQKTAVGDVADVRFVSAWLMLFENRDGKWIRIADASTFKP